MSGLKQTLLAESGALTSYSHRVFTAWDFGLCGDVHVRLRQRIILYELQVRVGVGSTSREGPPKGRSSETLGGAFFEGGEPREMRGLGGRPCRDT